MKGECGEDGHCSDGVVENQWSFEARSGVQRIRSRMSVAPVAGEM